MDRLTKRNKDGVADVVFITAQQTILDKLAHYEDLEEQGRLIVTPETGIGNLSDGYHTFNELYHHRAVLFSVICNAFKSCAWKSKKHSDGTMYDGMFIVGIDTPEGSATYHYDIEPYWNMFDVKELDNAPEWDGHTPDDAISRIAGLSKSNRLIELPCAVGDTVWIVRGNVYEAKVCRIVSHIPTPNDYITLDVVYEHIDFFYNDGRTTKDTALCRYLSDAFLTKEEAEAKLKELEE